MQTQNNVHQQFAGYFNSELLKPFAYLVSKKLSEGHICLQVNEAVKELEDSSFYNATIVSNNIDKLKDEPLVTVKDPNRQPFVLHNGRLYLQRYFNYETCVLRRITSFIESEKVELENRAKQLSQHTNFISSVFYTTGLKSTVAKQVDWQLVAALTAVLNNFTIITGGPGTGKTTTVAKILAILYTITPELKVALAAPTGKAAVRMAESLNASPLHVAGHIKENFKTMSPGTIHRLLKYVPDSPYFKHNRENPLNFDVVIVDESSMIDVALFAKLLDAIGPKTKLILLGDKDQLASVEAGSLFGDLCKSQQASEDFSAERVELINAFITRKQSYISDDYISKDSRHLLSNHIVELKHSHRFSNDKGIGKFSRAVIKNDVATLLEYIHKNTDEQVTIDVEYNTPLLEQFADGYTDYISEPDIKKAIQKLNKLRVLCAVKEGAHGLYNLNTVIENYLRKKKVINKTSEYYENRPIIITKNYYSLGLFNGDVGIIRPDENGVIKAWFEDGNNNLKSVFPGYVAASETVFAMTIHKSQGSEFDKVLVVLPNNTNMSLLTRELLYTAVTRAKLKVIVQATEDVILHTTEKIVARASGIIERLDEMV